MLVTEYMEGGDLHNALRRTATRDALRWYKRCGDSIRRLKHLHDDVVTAGLRSEEVISVLAANFICFMHLGPCLIANGGMRVHGVRAGAHTAAGCQAMANPCSLMWPEALIFCTRTTSFI